MVGVVMNANEEIKVTSEQVPRRTEVAGGEQAPRRKFPAFPLPKPDKEEFKAAVDKVSNEITSLDKRIHVLKGEIESRRQSRSSLSPELVEARNTLGVLNGEFNNQLEEKRALRTELDNAVKEVKERRAEARAFREKHPQVKPAADHVDEEIKKLEYRQQHYSLSNKEERELLQKIKELNKFRELLPEYERLLEQISEGEQLQKLAHEKLNAKDKLLSEIRTKIDKQKVVVDAIRGKEKDKPVDISALAVERNAAYERIKALRVDLKALRDDFKAKNEEWFVKKQAFFKEQEEKERALKKRRHAEWLQRRAVYEERQKAREQREQENFVEKFTDEILLCDQLVSCLQKLLPSDEGEKTETVKSEIPVPAGFGNLLRSKKDREAEEMESWFAGSKKGGKKGKAASKLREKITLAMEIINSLTRINVRQPLTSGEVPEAIEQVKLKRDGYVKLQAESKAAREAALEKKMAAAKAEEEVDEAEEAEAELEEEQNGTVSEENSVEDGTEPDSAELEEKSVESVELDSTESDGVTEKSDEATRDNNIVEKIDEPEGKAAVVAESEDATRGEESLEKN